MKKKSYVLDTNIKRVLARNISIIYSRSTKETFETVHRFVSYHLKTNKGVKSMIALAKKHSKLIRGVDVKKLMLEISVCEQLYFADKGRG